MSALSDRSRDALAEGGALAGAIPAFAPRPGQQRLAEAVATAFESRASLLAEAGTGTGKTYAYLVPALLSGMKTIVSTGTRALQDQLYHRDLPRVRDALGVGLKTALLKGRANYLCLYRMEQAKGEAGFGDREQVSQFQRIVAWSGRTRMGDMAELEGLPEDSPLLPLQGHRLRAQVLDHRVAQRLHRQFGVVLARDRPDPGHHRFDFVRGRRRRGTTAIGARACRKQQAKACRQHCRQQAHGHGRCCSCCGASAASPSRSPQPNQLRQPPFSSGSA